MARVSVRHLLRLWLAPEHLGMATIDSTSLHRWTSTTDNESGYRWVPTLGQSDESCYLGSESIRDFHVQPLPTHARRAPPAQHTVELAGSWPHIVQIRKRAHQRRSKTRLERLKRFINLFPSLDVVCEDGCVLRSVCLAIHK